MSDFQPRLDAFFEGNASLQELEREIDRLATDPEYVQHVLGVLEREFESGRLPTQIYHALRNRLRQAEMPDDDSTRHVQLQPEPDEETVRPNIQPEPQQESVDQTVQPEERDETALQSLDATRLADAPIAPPGAGPGVSDVPPELHRPRQHTGATGSNWARPDQWTETDSGPIQPGSVIKKRFVIDSELGKGGMGIVFKALDRRKEEAQDSDPYVAIKILNEEFRSHPQALIALEREASKAQTLAHPNIVTVYDFDRDGTTVYMTMELMRGESLSERIGRFRIGGASREEAVPIIMEMAAGLAYAHKREIVHSDFKPGNVFLTDDDRVKVLDFGIARATRFGGADRGSEAVFDAGDLGALTPAYASLEMLNGEAPHPADDVYALAVTAYSLLFGEHPFNRLTAKEAYEKGLKPQPIKGLKRREWKAISRGLEFRRADRIQDAELFQRVFRGPTKIARSAAATILVLIGVASFFAYQSIQEPGPAIPFDELPVAVQAEFNEKVASGQAWLDNEPVWIHGAFVEFDDAYDIHPRNPIATKGLNSVAAEFIVWTDSQTTTQGKKRTLDDLVVLLENEYLSEHKELRKLKERLVTDVYQD